MQRTSYAAAIAVALAIGAAGAARAAEYNANNFLDQNHPFSVHNYTEWAENLKKATNGELTFKVFLGGSLVPARSTLQGVKDGLAHVAYHAGTYTPSELPYTNAVADLALYESDIYISMMAAGELQMLHPKMLEEYKKVGVVFVGGYSTAPYLLLCNKKISSLAEIRGKRLRMPGAVWDRWARAMNAQSVNVPSSEIFTGLERGTLDCGGNPLESLQSRSWWDVSKFVFEIPMGVYYSGPMWAYNIPFWQGLKPEMKKAIFEQTAVGMVRSSIAYLKNTKDTADKMGAKGVVWVKAAPDLQKAHDEFVAKDAADLGKSAVERFKIPEAEVNAMVAEYKKLVEKWRAAFKGVDPYDEKKLVQIIKTQFFDKIDVTKHGM